MSLVKNGTGAGWSANKKFNLTIQPSNVHPLSSVGNRTGAWKENTKKLLQTLVSHNNHTKNTNSNVMTEDDIDKLFKKFKHSVKHSDGNKGKNYTEVGEGWDGGMARKNYVHQVDFLRLEEEEDKFMTGIPREFCQEDRIARLLTKNQSQDLTQEFKKNYLVGKVIGQGAYASVRVAIYKPEDKKIAIKIYKKDKIKQHQRKKAIRREITILSLLNHENIVNILDVVQSNNHLNIIMEYLTGNSLGCFLKVQPNRRIAERDCKKIFQALAKALKYMHGMNIAHRDIKLENIILDQLLNPKIIDFGFSTCIEPGKKIKIFCGTPSYMAPQVVQKKEYRGEGADIWAFGVMLFVCLTGIFPFKGSTDQQLYKKINSSDYPKDELFFSRNVSDLMARMLTIDPDERITAGEIIRHPWFSERSQSKKKNTESSLQNGRKRVNTQNSASLKEKWANKTGLLKKTLCQTTQHQNLKLQIRLALQSPKMRQQIQSYRLSNKENTIKMVKAEKTPIVDRKDRTNKINSKLIDMARNEMIKKRESQKSRNKKKL